MASPARFFDGETAEVHEVGLRPGVSELILVRMADSSIVARWPVDELVVLGDTEHEAVPPIARRGHDARLVVEDADLRRQLAAAMPHVARVAAPPPAATPRIALFGATLAALVGLFWVGIDFGSGYAADLVPYSLQARLGRAVLGELTGNEQACEGRQGLRAINRLANRLSEAAGYPHEVTVHIVKGGPANAFTLPGGVLMFNSELIAKAKDGTQVAGVLAHEIGHVVHNHPMKGLMRQFGLDLVLRALTGGYSDISTVASGGGLLLAMRNGRAFEREADATGVSLLEKLGLRADGVSSFFQQLMENRPHDAAELVGIWSSHPPTAERIAATKRPPTGRPPFSEAEWKALREACN